MDFKEYYHNRLNEDGTINEPLDADAPVKEAPQAQPAQYNEALRRHNLLRLHQCPTR